MVVKIIIGKEKVLTELKEKAVSKKQQRFFGMVRAAQKGEGAASPEVAKVAGEISKKDAKDFAKTKHKGLPEKKEVKEEKKGRGKRDQAELDRAQAYLKKHPNFGRERGKKDQAELDRAQSYIKKHPKFGLKKEDVNEGREERSGKDSYLPFKVCYDDAEPYVLYGKSVAEIKIQLRKIYRPENHKKIYVKRLYPNEVIKLYYDLRMKALTNQ